VGKIYHAYRRPRRLCVMHVITRLVRGGAQNVVLALLRGLRGKELDLILVAGAQTGAEGSLWDEADGLGITTVRLPSLVRRIAPFRDYRALNDLRRIIRAYRPHIVHAHTSKAGFLGCLAARRERVPAVVLAPHGHILGEGAQIPGIPAWGLRRALLAAACRRNARYADAVVAPNEAERRDGIRLGLWAAERATTVPNGVDTDCFRPRDQRAAREKIGVPIGVPIVGTVARLTREKGIDFALETLRMLPRVLLVIVGDGPERESLETLAASLGVEDRTRFLSVRNDIEEILPAFDVCLVPSRTESHGMTAAEALACEVPVVASDVGGLRSLVLHRRTGLRVRPGETTGYARALAFLLGDQPLRKRMGRAGRAHIVASYSSGAMVDETLRLYRSLLDHSGASAWAAASSVR
jgi:glycosyltransferase involved in cell wall biosynthesis